MIAPPRYPSYATFARTPARFLMSVLSKRTYRWTPQGDVYPVEEQPPLARDIVCVPREDRNCEVMVQGRDTWPLKRATDIVVSGHVRPPLGLPILRQDVEVSVGTHVRKILALGPRYVDYRGRGSMYFSSPEPFMSIELSWWNAYGGVDPTQLPIGLDDTPLFLGKPILELFPGAYPRNPAGTGYLVTETREYLEGLTLPQLEEPSSLLRPETLLVRDAERWWQRPAPANLGWYHLLWYPRILHTGGKPYHLPPPSAAGPAAEVPAEVAADVEDGVPVEPGQPNPSLDVTNEAAPELIVPFLSGDEVVGLNGFGTRTKQQFRLPRERPRVRARADGSELSELECRIHTLAIDTDKQQFYLLFSSRFEIPDDLAADLSAGTTRSDVVSRCQVEVDGYALGADDWPAVGEEEGG